MKNKLILALLLMAVLASCKKESGLSPEKEPLKEKRNAVVFKTGFGSSVETFTLLSNNRQMAEGGAKTSDITTAVNQLTYLVYDKDGVEMNRMTQTLSYPGFGTFQDSLIAGDYTIVVIGSKQTFGINSRYNAASEPSQNKKNLSEAYWEYVRALTPIYRTDDTFLGKIKVTVSSNTPSQNISLNRIVGRLEINIQDAVPGDAGQVLFSFNNEGNAYMIDSGTPYGTIFDDPVISYTFKRDDLGKTNFRFGAYILNTIKPMDVSIKSYSSEGKIIGEAKVTGILVYKNKKTVLSGKLFGVRNPTNTGSVIGINEGWDSEIVNNF